MASIDIRNQESKSIDTRLLDDCLFRSRNRLQIKPEGDVDCTKDRFAFRFIWNSDENKLKKSYLGSINYSQRDEGLIIQLIISMGRKKVCLS